MVQDDCMDFPITPKHRGAGDVVVSDELTTEARTIDFYEVKHTRLSA